MNSKKSQRCRLRALSGFCCGLGVCLGRWDMYVPLSLHITYSFDLTSSIVRRQWILYFQAHLVNVIKSILGRNQLFSTLFHIFVGNLRPWPEFGILIFYQCHNQLLNRSKGIHYKRNGTQILTIPDSLIRAGHSLWHIIRLPIRHDLVNDLRSQVVIYRH